MPKASPETLHTCPRCGQENFTARGLAGHLGKGHCKRRAAELEIAPADNVAIVATNGGNLPILPLSPLGDGVAVIRWLELAIPAYQRSRGQLARQAVMIGYACICIRDFGARGSLAALKKMQFFQASARTIDRCIKAAQIYAESRGLVTPKGQLTEVSEPEKLFHPEFDFSDPSAHPLSLDIAEYVGDANIADLLERDILEGDSSAPPQDHQKDSSKKRAVKETAEQRRAAYVKAFTTWQEKHGSGGWKALYLNGNPKLKTIGTLDVEAALKAALEVVQAHNKTEAAKERGRA